MIKEKHLNKIYKFDCVKAMKRLLANSIDLVSIDPPYLHDKGGNGGGGTAAESCLRLNRKFIGFEIDEKYYESSIIRIERVLNELNENNLQEM